MQLQCPFPDTAVFQRLLHAILKRACVLRRKLDDKGYLLKRYTVRESGIERKQETRSAIPYVEGVVHNRKAGIPGRLMKYEKRF